MNTEAPRDERTPDPEGERKVLVWAVCFLATMALFVLYCWWRAHEGMA